MPVRKIKKSYRSVTGYFMSKKNNKQLAFESTLERDLFMSLEFDQDVLAYEEQPFTIYHQCNSTKSKYTPDCYVHYTDGSKVVEVKYEDELCSDANLRSKLECLQNILYETEGLQLEIFTDKVIDPIIMKNYKFLYKFAFLKIPNDVNTLIRYRIESISASLSIKEFLYSLDNASTNHPKLVPFLWSYLCINPHLLDLEKALNMNTLIVGTNRAKN